MNSTPALVTLSSVVAFSISACSLVTGSRFGSAESVTFEADPGSPQTPAAEDARALLVSGINAYNDGNTTEAKKTLESVLATTEHQNLPRVRAVAHFYLAAVAWDFGDKRETNEHLRQCRFLQPGYEPDWTFLAPSLRKRYEALH